jgi:ABC-type antimicrobial peptide transport system permease subunit
VNYLEFWRTPARLAAGLSAALGTLALLLASAGVYGTVCFAVNRRVREIGIRMTLGANNRDVLRLILHQAMRPVLIGAVVGIVCCASVSWGLSRILFGLSSYDPPAFFSAPVFLVGVALLASYLPARRALRLDPMVALRYE